MADRKVLIIGNWKMNKTASETKVFFKTFTSLYEQTKSEIAPSVRFGFAVPAVNLYLLQARSIAKAMVVAAQNAYFAPQGAYTGELSLAMLKEVGVSAIIIGHSERRQFFGETDELVNKKVLATLKANLIPIVCVGETLAQRKSGRWKQILSKQVKSLYKTVSIESASNIVIAYEPIWAIGTGITASMSEAQEACSFVRSIIANLTSLVVAAKTVIQYGGSVKPNNIASFLAQNDIDGALVGGASLNPQTFIRLLTMSKQ